MLDRPYLVKGTLVCGSCRTLKNGDFRLEVVIVDFGRQLRKHLFLDDFGNKEPESVVGLGEFPNLVLTEQTGESILDGLQV